MDRRPDITDAEIRRLYVDEGMSEVDVARLLDCNRVTIARRLQRMGVPTRQYRPDVQDADIVRMYVDERLSEAEIAFLLDCSKSTVNRRLRRAGVPARQVGTAEWATATDDDLKALYENQRWPIRKIADHFFVSEPWVRNRLRRAGTKMRTQPERHTKPVDNTHLQHLYERGLTLRATGYRVGLDDSTVGRRLERAGVPRRTGGGHQGPEPRLDVTVEEVKRLYVDEWLTLTEIARLLDASPTTIANRLDSAGVPRRTFADYCAARVDRDELVRLYVDEQVPVDEIATRKRMATHTVYSHLRAAGVDPDRRRRPRAVAVGGVKRSARRGT